jgi:hypothetical protein
MKESQFLNTRNIVYVDLNHIYSVIEHKYVGIADEGNGLAVGHQGQLDHSLWINLRLFRFIFKIRKQGMRGMFLSFDSSAPSECKAEGTPRKLAAAMELRRPYVQARLITVLGKSSNSEHYAPSSELRRVLMMVYNAQNYWILR